MFETLGSRDFQVLKYLKKPLLGHTYDPSTPRAEARSQIGPSIWSWLTKQVPKQPDQNEIMSPKANKNKINPPKYFY